jgi:hypothetical protein
LAAASNQQIHSIIDINVIYLSSLCVHKYYKQENFFTLEFCEHRRSQSIIRQKTDGTDGGGEENDMAWKKDLFSFINYSKANNKRRKKREKKCIRIQTDEQTTLSTMDMYRGEY